MRRHRLLRTSLVAAAGATAMYFADPEAGPLRRALLRQRFALFARRAEDTVINEPLATADAMLDVRDVDAVYVEVVSEVEPTDSSAGRDQRGPGGELPTREPIRDDTMTIDEALFHAARTS